MTSRRLSFTIAAAAAVCTATAIVAQRPDAFDASRDHPAISYSKGPTATAVDALNTQLAAGGATFTFDSTSGYLRSVLDALKIPIDSQVLVFSQTSFQADLVSPKNPRALYFNDTVAVGWVRGADVLEVAARDPRQGTIFYTLSQKPGAKPTLQRDNTCLACHLTWETLGVPGLFVLTTFPMSDDPNAYARGFVSDHRSPFGQRWGGYYVTGRAPEDHMGNVPVIYPRASPPPSGPPPVLQSVEGKFDTKGFPTVNSDVAALMVLEHQTRMGNLISRVGWEARLAAAPAAPVAAAPNAAPPKPQPDRVEAAATDLVDYLLFVDEEPLRTPTKGSSGFAATFSARGPRDSKGRSLFQLDLERRLLRHPCSYMIYTEAFDALPPAGKEAVYRRMWAVLSGAEMKAPYNKLAEADRRTIIEILKDTKQDLPGYFK